MIIIKLQGGLGNQMFQYSLGRYLAFKNNTILKLDITWFNKKKKFTKRNYDLNIFNILENFALEEEIEKFNKYKKRNGLRNVFHNLFSANKSIYIKKKNIILTKKF